MSVHSVESNSRVRTLLHCLELQRLRTHLENPSLLLPLPLSPHPNNNQLGYLMLLIWAFAPPLLLLGYLFTVQLEHKVALLYPRIVQPPLHYHLPKFRPRMTSISSLLPEPFPLVPWNSQTMRLYLTHPSLLNPSITLPPLFPRTSSSLPDPLP